jgi:fructose-1,6-bisphosphatase I
MAMIVEQAGGIASTGFFQGKIGRVSQLLPDAIHCKCPIIMGGARDVGVIYDCYRKAGIDTPSL